MSFQSRIEWSQEFRIDLVQVRFEPMEVVGELGVDTRFVGSGTAMAPAGDAHHCVSTIH